MIDAISEKHRLKEFCEESLEDRVSSTFYRIKVLKRENKNLFQRVLISNQKLPSAPKLARKSHGL